VEMPRFLSRRFSLGSGRSENVGFKIVAMIHPGGSAWPDLWVVVAFFGKSLLFCFGSRFFLEAGVIFEL